MLMCCVCSGRAGIGLIEEQARRFLLSFSHWSGRTVAVDINTAQRLSIFTFLLHSRDDWNTCRLHFVRQDVQEYKHLCLETNSF